jgi:predicted nuclease with TOPRIM domain
LAFDVFPQLQGKFEQLKRLHSEEKSKLDEKRRSLEDEINTFSKKKAAAELLQGQSFNTNANLKKDKDRKK